jgi:hypothetical protein
MTHEHVYGNAQHWCLLMLILSFPLQVFSIETSIHMFGSSIVREFGLINEPACVSIISYRPFDCAELKVNCHQ